MNAFALSSVSTGHRSARTALDGAARFWFLAVLAGQAIFAFTTASFYGLTAWRGDFNAWGRGAAHGYVAGDTPGNLAVGLHLLLATIVTAAGTLQLIPRLRTRAPGLHRWNGR